MNDLDILQQINKIGQLLLKHGAEIYRVEESLKRMCEGFGFTDIEVFAIPSYFTLSLTLHDGTPYHPGDHVVIILIWIIYMNSIA